MEKPGQVCWPVVPARPGTPRAEARRDDQERCQRSTPRPAIPRSSTQERTGMHKPTNDKPNVVPANVTNLRDELQRLTATEKPDGRGGRSQLPGQDARTM